MIIGGQEGGKGCLLLLPTVMFLLSERLQKFLNLSNYKRPPAHCDYQKHEYREWKPTERSSHGTCTSLPCVGFPSTMVSDCFSSNYLCRSPNYHAMVRVHGTRRSRTSLWCMKTRWFVNACCHLGIKTSAFNARPWVFLREGVVEERKEKVCAIKG